MVEAFNRFLTWITRNVKKTIGMILIVAVMAIAFTLAFRYGYSFMHRDAYAKREDVSNMVTIHVEEEMTTDTIADLLVKAGLLDSTLEFRIKARLLGASDFKFGVYHIANNATVEEIIAILKKGDQSNVASVVISNGMTVDDLAEELQTLDVCSANGFKKACQNTNYDMDFIDVLDVTNRRYALEGYLLPGSYQIIKDSDPASVCRVFLEEFQNRFTSVMRSQMEEKKMKNDIRAGCHSGLGDPEGMQSDLRLCKICGHAPKPYPIEK